MKDMSEYNNQDEGTEFLESLKAASSIPDPQFKNMLEQKMLKRAQSSNILSNFINSMSNFSFQNAKFRMAVFLVSVMLVGAGFGGYYLFATKQAKENANLSDEQIFAKIIENNSNDTISPTSRLSADSTASTYETSDLRIAPFYNEDFNYLNTVSEYRSGPKWSACYSYNGQDGKFISTSFFDKDSGIYYAKYKSLDSNNNLYDYSLQNATNSYMYRGGSYATISEANSFYRILEDDATEEDISEFSEDTPVMSEEEIQPSDIKNYFGENAEVLGTEKVGNKEYYIIRWTYDAFCDAIEDTNNQNKTLTVEALVDTETYEIIGQEQYFGEVSNDNLIDSITISTEKKNVTLAEVASEFEFEFDVEVKVMETTNYDPKSDEYLNAVRQLLQNEQVNLILPVISEEYTFTGVYSSNIDLPGLSYDEVLGDRLFYPEGELGDKTFKEFVSYEETIMPSVSLSYIDYDLPKSVVVEVYPSSVSQTSLEELYSPYFTNQPIDTTVNLDGVEVAADLYEYELMVDKPAEESIDDTYCVDCDKPTYLLVFEAQGSKYLVTIYGFDTVEDFKNEIASFTTYRHNNANEMNAVIDYFKTNTPESNDDLILY